ncbi:MAG: cell division protein ZapA [Burkholderiales bacterium]|nr:cell division protein ZapA [Burkholderiales bacterium]
MSAKPGGSPERTVTLDIHLLGRDYKVACKEHEREELMQAVTFLDQRMREIRSGGKTAGVDRIAVMAALNIANDLLRERRAPAAAGASVDGDAARRRIQSMHAAIDQALAGQDKLF